ncbi:RING finger and CHY zinc finger domain-containing protein 1 isoform 1 [Theobroma cacao]|uniref:RING finger and CHY zinc finger domain-containing protein 1 isoform 1 n=1 Tax=Theobroma cacao TaxID=3641 RepID=A0A061EP35_THECC|nr:RING finger and CHY zinc finger domain-containing protein 1 isoform 1 [Theobroma cacao]
MQVLSNARNFAGGLGSQTILLNSNHRLLSSLTRINSSPLSSLQCHVLTEASSGLCRGSYFPMPQHLVYSIISRTCFSTEAGTANSNPTEAVKELYDNMLQSVNVKRTMPPNASLWSMIENCKNHEDIKLLFDVLQNLRRFRLSNLRIHSNFNCNLCQEVTRACARVGAIDFGKKALWKHNVYGLTPSIASAHHLLLNAKGRNDAKLMVEVMQLLKRNNLPLQAGTADIFFSICYNTNNWELISKYSKKFIKAGVKLRQTTFDTWMKFAAQRGDTESLWNIEYLRSETMKQHTLTTGFSCAKGLLLEGKPEDAAALIQVLNQTLSDAKKPGIAVEVEKLVNEWPSDVIKHQKEEDRKALAASLKSDIPAMVASLLNTGFTMSINLEDLTKKEIPS